MKKFTLLLLFIAPFKLCFTQTIKVISSGTKTSIRGLSAVTDKIIWVSGSNGMIGRSVDGGTTWRWLQVKGFEKTDFRDIEAFDETSAVIMGIDAPAYILRTIDGGETWKVVYENKTKGMFLDAMEFWNEQSGIVIGDPIDKRMFIARTFDGGNSWSEVPKQNMPQADSGEACFASSGTNIRKLSKNEACFITGGLRSRLFMRDNKTDLPILQGKESTGANSIAVKSDRTFIIVGGDFTLPEMTLKNCFVTKDGGKTWAVPEIPPPGYRSCVEHLKKKRWVTCGLNGVDYSTDDGNTWQSISSEGFHVCRKAKKGSVVYFAGGGGKVAKMLPL